MRGKNIVKGMAAGLTATVALSTLMVLKSVMGLMPEFDVIAMLTGMMGASSPLAGWLVHFAIGILILGSLFAWLDMNLPGNRHWLNGIFFGIGAWLVMMILMMPVAGAGFFGLKFGVIAPMESWRPS